MVVYTVLYLSIHVNGIKLFVSYYLTVSLRLLASSYCFESIIPSGSQRDCTEIISLMLTAS